MVNKGIDFQKKLEEQMDRDYMHIIEEDPSVFHPSKLSKCLRQGYLTKLGLRYVTNATKGRFRVGQMIHKYMERLDVDGEKEVYKEKKFGDITLHGTADLVTDNVIYDYKTRKSWYKFNPPDKNYLNQITLYMKMFGKKKARLVYISKGELEVRCYPECRSGKFIEFDEDRFQGLMQKARELRDAIEEYGIPEKPEDIPFDKCGCWMCKNEKLVLEKFGQG